jgi:hypothetical protein
LAGRVGSEISVAKFVESGSSTRDVVLNVVNFVERTSNSVGVTKTLLALVVVRLDHLHKFFNDESSVCQVLP